MKNIFKKIAVVALAMIMCVSAAVPVAFAEEAKCPGEGKTHTSANCDYVVVSQNEASCEVGGFVTGKCNGCSATFVVNSVDELGHDWEVGAVSCLTATKKTCKRCGKEEIVPGSATGHSFGEWITKGDKGCFVGNRRYRVCSACGETEEQTMREDHSWIVAVYVAPVNCTAPGRATYICENSGCDVTKTAQLWAKAEDAGHDYQRWDSNAADVVKLTKGKKDPNAATLSCTSDGARTEICIDCGETRVIYTDKGTYQHTLDDMKFVDAVLDLKACTTNAYRPYWECYYCGVMYEQKTDGTNGQTYYAEWGTFAPVYTLDEVRAMIAAEGKTYVVPTLTIGGTANDTYYPIYTAYTWRDADYYINNGQADIKFVEGSEFKKITKATTISTHGHRNINANGKIIDGTTKVAPDCITPGYTEVNCLMCGKYSFTNTEALGHKFYADVTKTADQTTVLSNLGLSGKTWANVGNTSKADGCGKIWNKVFLPTCTNYASVEWRCLNTVGSQCTETKVTPVTGTRNAPYGHDFNEVEVLAATCLTAGLCDNVCSRPVQSYTISSGTTKVIVTEKVEGTTDDLLCGTTERKSVAALGHKWVKDADNAGNVAVSCEDDGIQWYECANSGCTATKKETIVSTGEEHLWSFFSYSTPNTTPTCVAGVEGYAICTKCDMLEAQLVTKEALGHKYLELDEEAMKLLEKKGDKLYVDADGKFYTAEATGRVLAVEYIVEGNCLESAVYKVFCQRDGCNITSVSEPNKDNVKEKHDVVILSAWYDVNGVYDSDAGNNANEYNTTATMITKLSCTATTYGSLWYCKDKNCSEYRVENFALTTASKWVDKNGNPAAPNRFEFFGKHFDSETGAVITYKDVPDERISSLDSLAEAQAVKAPTDENGNIIAYAVEIPGTSLVWRYATDEVTCDADEVEVGGFYCVDCSNANYTSNDKCVVGDTRVAHHDVKKGDAVPANCMVYGYTPYSCKNCGYTVQTAYEAIRESHDIDLTAPVSVIKATCEKTGAKIYQCNYDDCRQFVTVVEPALGHYNVSGEELLASCLDPNANVENRRCKNCSQIILPAHNYVNGKCDECGVAKEN